MIKHNGFKKRKINSSGYPSSLRLTDYFCSGWQLEGYDLSSDKSWRIRAYIPYNRRPYIGLRRF